MCTECFFNSFTFLLLLLMKNDLVSEQLITSRQYSSNANKVDDIMNIVLIALIFSKVSFWTFRENIILSKIDYTWFHIKPRPSIHHRILKYHINHQGLLVHCRDERSQTKEKKASNFIFIPHQLIDMEVDDNLERNLLVRIRLN